MTNTIVIASRRRLPAWRSMRQLLTTPTTALSASAVAPCKYRCHREPVEFTRATIHATSSNTKARCRSTNRRYRCDSLHGLLRRCAPRNDNNGRDACPHASGRTSSMKCGRPGSRPHHHLSSRAGAVHRRGDPSNCRASTRKETVVRPPRRAWSWISWSKLLAMAMGLR